ncbi:MAG TPA: M20/M25/M40 family metallo-hydrolase [Sphingobacteriaceae bacterium]|nr:M20/M25/M40 family metallo-hydrolase [Sphingobacteriaceae bacterium]
MLPPGVDAVVYRKAAAWLEPRLEEYIEEIIAVCQIPAPTFAEARRGRWVAQRFLQEGLEDVHMDQVGNVLGRLGPDRPRAPALVVSAHLDTVFPAHVDVTVRRRANRLWAPGVSDNSASVAALIMLAKALQAAGFTAEAPIWFVGNVCEEGLGDLRGMKHLLGPGLAGRQQVGACLVLDGSLGLICHQAIGSRRLEVTFRGPGGHSWGDYGNPSAIHVMAHAAAALDRLPLPQKPRTTLNIGLVEGGTAVNVIAHEASFVIDLRSEDAAELVRLERQVRALCIREAQGRGVRVAVKVVGDRPTGALAGDHPLVQAARAAAAACRIPAYHRASSTDANVPLAKGIPALCIGIKRGRGAHTLDEYLDIDSLMPGLIFGLLACLAAHAWVARLPVPSPGEEAG